MISVATSERTQRRRRLALAKSRLFGDSAARDGAHLERRFCVSICTLTSKASKERQPEVAHLERVHVFLEQHVVVPEALRHANCLFQSRLLSIRQACGIRQHTSEEVLRQANRHFQSRLLCVCPRAP